MLEKALGLWEDQKDTALVLLFTVLSCWTRFRHLADSNRVVWDEAHFGKFGSYYLKHEFYHDVHPPLGKMLVALGGFLSGYRGQFDFKSGTTYPEDVNYHGMRIFCAIFGMIIVPLAYMSAINLGFPRRAAILAATMILLDNALLTISRFILLDSFLLGFTALTFFTLTCFHNERRDPFTLEWWLWLSLTGISLGLVSSVKWVGFFAVALVGLYTLDELYQMFGNLRMPKITYAYHWIARIVCLIVIPVIIYLFCFWIHFALLTRSGTGDAQMSSLFQANLRGSNLVENPLKLAYGSTVTFKNYAYGGGLLHSHVQTYPEGSKQQQVTCYHHKDNNNEMVIAHTRNHPDNNATIHHDHTLPVQYVRHGDIIRLVHKSTSRNLHSHEVDAPITKGAWEVSGYGSEAVGDVNDHWKVEVVDDVTGQDTQGHIHSLTTRVRFRHVRLNCLLRSTHENLPEWGFKQAEVVCDRRPAKEAMWDTQAMWNVEYHRHPKLSPAEASTYRTRFLADVANINVAMWKSNNALVPAEDKADPLSSEPYQWPLLLLGLRMCGWESDRIRYFLIGNPIVWWSSTVAILLYGVATLYYLVRTKRRCVDWTPAGWVYFQDVGKLVVGGWFLHYAPFAIMGRVTYIHHYFPAVYFASFMVPFLLELFVSRWSQERNKDRVFWAAGAIVVGTFLFFWPITYGMTGPSEDYKRLEWLSTWTVAELKNN
ncbi:glycosyltransferase family 39 protein [Piptocephalis cylindrospora]|uniref:Dolichyl-phosphate-mannose--protein mannosyltransferase n=1 Tax=Piptocephalis cylindrospora TaxID=1907219 RepID=A0A4P9Y0A6_9FUNG|nr:glycosyltransferase family 39 protein [Piptocephalis cylindrospora]|eukprot:RKP12137.1 glycosyltransferase family 39 protein [Piptocephalis cylindrospora]